VFDGEEGGEPWLLLASTASPLCPHALSVGRKAKTGPHLTTYPHGTVKMSPHSRLRDATYAVRHGETNPAVSAAVAAGNQAMGHDTHLVSPSLPCGMACSAKATHVVSDLFSFFSHTHPFVIHICHSCGVVVGLEISFFSHYAEFFMIYEYDNTNSVDFYDYDS